MKEKKKMGAGKIILIVFIVLAVLGAGAVVAVKMFFNNLKVEELSEEHKTGVWYKFTPDGAIDSIGEPWHGLTG